MTTKDRFKNLIKSAVSVLKPFEEDNTEMESVFFNLSELAGDLNLPEYRILCLELMMYCLGSETGEFAYKSKEGVLEKIK